MGIIKFVATNDTKAKINGRVIVCLLMVIGGVGKLVTPGDCKSPAPGIVGSSPTASTKNLQSVVLT